MSLHETATGRHLRGQVESHVGTESLKLLSSQQDCQHVVPCGFLYHVLFPGEIATFFISLVSRDSMILVSVSGLFLGGRVCGEG